jgi:hypothetical protein
MLWLAILYLAIAVISTQNSGSSTVQAYGVHQPNIWLKYDQNFNRRVSPRAARQVIQNNKTIRKKTSVHETISQSPWLTFNSIHSPRHPNP